MNQLQAPSQYDAPTVVTLRRTFAALRRDWKLALLPIVLIPVATYILASNGSPRYQAAASVLLNRGNLANSVIGASDPTQSETDADVVATQLQVAQSTAVLTRAVQLIGRPASSARQLASNSSVAPSGTSLVITFSVDEATPNLAQRLANAYAHAYVAYRHQIDSQPYTAALQAVQAKVAQLRSAGGAGSQAVVNSLASREEQLVTLETLQVGNVSVLSQAATAAQIAPRSTKDTALALLIAIVLGLGAVLGKDAFDTRVRNQEAISEFSDVPVIGSLPTPSTRWPSVDQLVQPGSHYSNAVAITRANLGFAFVGDRHGIVVVTSSLPSEGKTTTTVNLAISLARSGRRVAVVDLDLRRPTVAEFIPNPPRRGFTDVVLGTTTLKDVMCDVDLGPNMRANRGFSAGSLTIIPSGSLPPSPADFLALPEVDALMHQIVADHDLVLVDTPPLLLLADVLVMSSFAQAVLVVARVGLVKRPQLQQTLARLDATGMRLLGIVATGAEASASYYYGYYPPKGSASADSASTEPDAKPEVTGHS